MVARWPTAGLDAWRYAVPPAAGRDGATVCDDGRESQHRRAVLRGWAVGVLRLGVRLRDAARRIVSGRARRFGARAHRRRHVAFRRRLLRGALTLRAERSTLQYAQPVRSRDLYPRAR